MQRVFIDTSELFPFTIMDVLLTRNMKHLRTGPVLAAGVQVITSDDFLMDLLKHHRQGVVESFLRAAAGKKNPPLTASELADKAAAAGAPNFVERLRGHLTS